MLICAKPKVGNRSQAWPYFEENNQSCKLQGGKSKHEKARDAEAGSSSPLLSALPIKEKWKKGKKLGHSDICYSNNFAFNIIHNYVIPVYDLASKQNPSYLWIKYSSRYIVSRIIKT